MRSLAAAGLCLLALACRPRDLDLPNHSTSSLALSRDGQLVYAVETDSATLAVVDATTSEKLADVPVGAGAHLVAVAPDDTVYVANRRDGSVSVIRRGEWSAAARWAAGVEPVGMALSPDGATLYVVSAIAPDTSTHGVLLALDARSGQLSWELALGREPRGITVIDDHAAVVALLKDGELLWVDLARRQLQPAAQSLYAALNQGSRPSTFHPRDLAAVAYDPSTRNLYALATLAREGPHDELHPCLKKLVAPPALLTFDPGRSPRVDAVNVCATLDEPMSAPLPTLAFTPGLSSPAVWNTQGGSAITFAETGKYVWIAHLHGNAVAWAFVRGQPGEPSWHTEPVGRGPSGLALAPEDRSVWVHNALDHTLTKITAGGGRGVLDTWPAISLGPDVLDADVVAGRKLFFDATDPRLTSRFRGVACATCHLEGGDEDGHVWQFAQGPRQTSSLAGGRLSGTAPFHWSGAFESFAALMQHTVERMGGTGLTPVMAQQLLAYLATVPPRARPEALDAERGRQLFARAECATCHAGAQLTNNQLVHVGTDETGFPPGGVNVPSLLGVGRTAPYLHDGSAATLREAVERHASTRALSAAELEELLGYLEQL